MHRQKTMGEQRSCTEACCERETIRALLWLTQGILLPILSVLPRWKIMTDLEKFIIESNNIEREDTYMDVELPIYEWWLANECTEENLKELHLKLCKSRKHGMRKTLHGAYRDCPVWIANRMGMKPHKIELAMKELFESDLNPYFFHKRYEEIHPFADLNGRTGRAIWLHQMLEEQDVPLGFLHTWYYQSLSYN